MNEQTIIHATEGMLKYFSVYEVPFDLNTVGEANVTVFDIAKLLGISRAYVSRIEKKAIGKLGDHLSAEDR